MFDARDYFLDLEEMSQIEEHGFFTDLEELALEEKHERRKANQLSYWQQLDVMEENERRLEQLMKAQRRTFIEEIEEMARQEKITKIIGRLNRVRAFDCFKYYPDNTEKTKQKHRQKSMLTGILSMLYNFIAFGYKDPLVPVARKRMHLFSAVRKYYRKYTGPEEGPRFRKIWAERQRLLKETEAQKAKADAKRDMLRHNTASAGR